MRSRLLSCMVDVRDAIVNSRWKITAEPYTLLVAL
jgi:hypothetical protein